MAWIFLIIAILAEVAGTSTLKATNGMTRPTLTALMALSYALSFYFLSLAFRSIPLGVAYAIWAGVGTIAVTLIGVYWFGQPIGGLRGATGVGLIVAGVAVLRLIAPAE